MASFLVPRAWYVFLDGGAQEEHKVPELLLVVHGETTNARWVVVAGVPTSLRLHCH